MNDEQIKAELAIVQIEKLLKVAEQQNHSMEIANKLFKEIHDRMETLLKLSQRLDVRVAALERIFSNQLVQ